jgi:hypothetical protein
VVPLPAAGKIVVVDDDFVVVLPVDNLEAVAQTVEAGIVAAVVVVDNKVEAAAQIVEVVVVAGDVVKFHSY